MKIVVGISAEKNIGFAISDLSGRIIKLFTARRFKKDKLIDHLLSFGIPCAIVVDKEKIPKIAKELAKEFDIPVLAPKKDITEKEKKSLTKGYSYKNRYERNALSAILYMFQRHAKIFKEIEEMLKNMGFETYVEKAKEVVLRGDASTAFQAVKKVLPSKGKEKKSRLLGEGAYKKMYEEATSYIKKLEEKIKKLEKENKNLLKKVPKKSREILEKTKELEQKVAFLEEELKKERKLRKEVEEKLEVMKEENYIEKQGLIPAVRIKKFSIDYLSHLKNNIRIFKRPVVVEGEASDEEAAEYLVKLQPSMVIGNFSEEVKAMFLKEQIPFLSEEEVEGKITSFNKFYGIKPEALEEITEMGRKRSFFKWLSFYKKKLL